MRWIDCIDIGIIAVFIYFLLRWLTQKSSRSVAIGGGVLVLVYILARALDLYLTALFFQIGFTAFLVTLVILFQTDIRRGLERLTTFQSFRSRHGVLPSSQTVDMLVESAARLAHDRVGALIVVKGLESIDRHIRGGISLNGRVSMPILHSIFQTSSPSHDGAVVIAGEFIERYAVYLPLSQHLKEGGEAGTRHAAALGLSEVCDAFVVVVSEERGVISIAQRGELEVVSAGELKTRLGKFYHTINPGAPKPRRMDWLRKNFVIKVAALSGAVLAWFFLARQDTLVHRTFAVPVEYRNVPPEFIVDKPEIPTLQVSISGQERAFNFNQSAMTVALDLSAVRDGSQDVRVSKQSLLNVPMQLTVNQIEPRTVRINAFATTTVTVPVRVPLVGSLPQGLGHLLVRCEPESVRVNVPKNARDEYTTLRTEAVVLDEISQNTTVKTNLILPNHVQMTDNGSTVIKVRLEVSEKK